ncbi:phage integrase N-terminal SAM-like domain-containing protein [Paenibacillus tarimensis]
MEISVSKRDEMTVAVKFHGFNKQGIEKIRTIPGRRWNPDESVWTIPYTIETVSKFLNVFKDCNLQIEAQLLEECYLLKAWHKRNSFQEQRLKEELQLKGYSPKTIRAYSGHVERFINFSNQGSDSRNQKIIQNYSLQLLNRKCSHSYVNQAISAIKFYFQKVLSAHSRFNSIRKTQKGEQTSECPFSKRNHADFKSNSQFET